MRESILFVNKSANKSKSGSINGAESMCKEVIRDIFLNAGGLVKTSDITRRGFHNSILNELIAQGKVTKVKRGFYQWIENGEKTEVAIVARLFPEAIICQESALYHYGYIDRTPQSWHIAVNKDSSKSKLALDYPPIKPYFIEPSYLEVGVTQEIIDGVTLRIYDRDRCICDAVRYANKMDREILNQAIHAYIQDKHKNISNLLDYAKKLRAYKKIHTWVGVWL